MAARRLDLVCQRVSGVRHDEVLVGQLPQADLFPPGKWVVDRHDQDQILFDQRTDLEQVGVGRHADDRHVQLALEQGTLELDRARLH